MQNMTFSCSCLIHSTSETSSLTSFHLRQSGNDHHSNIESNHLSTPPPTVHTDKSDNESPRIIHENLGNARLYPSSTSGIGHDNSSNRFGRQQPPLHYQHQQPAPLIPHHNNVITHSLVYSKKSEHSGSELSLVGHDQYETASNFSIKNNDHDYDNLRRKLSSLRQENSKLVGENHKLHNDFESLSYELRQSHTKIDYLTQEIENQRQHIPSLEDRVVSLEAEASIQDKNMKQIEAELNQSQHQLKSKSDDLKKLQNDKKEWDSQLSKLTQDRERYKLN